MDEIMTASAGPGNSAETPRLPEYGALVISLDFELHWGVRDKHPVDGEYRQNLLGARSVIPRMLELFEEFQAAATWATVGFLFAQSRAELVSYSPSLKPKYTDTSLSPYGELLGSGEEDDPLHFAPSVLEAIRNTPRQEIATHTFSHYYCLAEGQSRPEFAADMRSAVQIAGRNGDEIRSIVFPRNQVNSDYNDVLRELGISCFRGNPVSWMYASGSRIFSARLLKRAGRLMDSYLPVAGDHLTSWNEVRRGDGLFNVPASFFIRPYSERLRHLEGRRLNRITRSIRNAAARRKIIHLWWHPHNFGRNQVQNLRFLRDLLSCFSRMREGFDMRSLNMAEVADLSIATTENG
jgi:peptidoglycan/xylan/chitin deacetylase (PgdA/CDA1 family)